MRTRRAFIGGAALALMCVSAASAGDHGQRGIAILPPLESPDTDRDGLHWWPHRYGLFVPYYGSPLTPISTRWRPIAYVPYYRGFCRPHVHYSTAPYGEVAFAPGCLADEHLATAGYGPYTGGPRDEATLLHLGGTGPYQPSQPGAVDIIDMLRGPHGPEPVSPP